MRRLLLIAGICVTSACSNAIVIYDSLYTDATQATTNTITDTTSTPRSMKGDVISFANYDAGQVGWKIDSLKFLIRNETGAATAGTVRISIYKDSFATLINSTLFSFGTLNNATTYFITAGYSNLVLSEPNGNGYGIVIDPLLNGQRTDTLLCRLTTTATGVLPYVGTSSNGWYRDVNNNGVIESSEGRTFSGSYSQMGLQVNASKVVPEPATIVGIGLGALALIRKRRK